MDKEEFKKRRDELWKNTDAEIIIIGSWPVQYLNGDVDYTYKQDPNFYYYTGIKEQDMTLIMEYHCEGDVNKRMDYIFARGSDPKQELWTGKRLSLQSIISDYGFDDAYQNECLDQVIHNICKAQNVNIYAHIPDKLNTVQLILNDSKKYIAPLKHIMESQRVIKSESEIEKLKKACELSAKVHNEIGEYIYHTNVNNEREIDGTIIGLMIKNGCQRLAYPNVVASGKNGTTLHYSANNGDIGSNDLILIDAGGELDYYASDITRTVPANRIFTQEQQNIYDLVLKAQMECICMVRSGITLMHIHEKSVEVITKGLLELGLLTGNLNDNINNESYKKFYMHKVGHWMGIDVHDCCSVDKSTTILEPGHVFTIEPGIYIGDDLTIPEKYRNIAVRIEDDILVTKNGYYNMTEIAYKYKKID